MADLDTFAPNYRRARELWIEAPTLSACHDSLCACLETNSHGMVEHIKSFIESVCLTILGEFGEPIPSFTPSTTELLVAALRPLGLQNTRGASKLDKLLSAFNRMTDALSEMRNEQGPVAHGKDGFLDAISADHARAFLLTGDLILSILLNALEGKEPDLTVTREPYERFSHLNERIDQAISVQVSVDDGSEPPMIVLSVATGPQSEAIEIRAEPSRLLYNVDREAYVEVLKTADFMALTVEDDEEGEEAQLVDSHLSFQDADTQPLVSERLVSVVPAYDGNLKGLHYSLERFIESESLSGSSTVSGDNLIDSLLATIDQNTGLDWKDRDVLQARLRVACKRVLVRFGVESKRADDIAQRLMAWARIQVTNPLESSSR